jgi:hypothetical protein
MRFALWCSLLLIIGIPVGCRKGASKGKTQTGSGVAVAKLIVQPTGSGSDELTIGALDDFYDKQIRLLNHDELKGMAQKKAFEANSELPAAAVTLQVARMSGNSIITLIGRSESPRLASSFLNELINTYVQRVQGVIADDLEIRARTETVRAKKAAAEKGLREAEKKLALFKLDHEATHAETDKAASQAKLKRLESARGFYQAELDITAKADLETDLQRRRNLVTPPADMPEEFQRLINSNLTPNEQAYVDALGRNDPATTKVTRLLAEGDQKARIESFKLQLGTVKQLTEDLQKRIREIEAAETSVKSLASAVDVARKAYDELKTAELQNDVTGAGNQPPGVLVTIIEKPAPVSTSK